MSSEIIFSDCLCPYSCPDIHIFFFEHQYCFYNSQKVHIWSFVWLFGSAVPSLLTKHSQPQRLGPGFLVHTTVCRGSMGSPGRSAFGGPSGMSGRLGIAELKWSPGSLRISQEEGDKFRSGLQDGEKETAKSCSLLFQTAQACAAQPRMVNMPVFKEHTINCLKALSFSARSYPSDLTFRHCRLPAGSGTRRGWARGAGLCVQRRRRRCEGCGN